ncbi:MAG: hypothetical protein ACPHF0_01530, partial [Poseidonia sp.]
MGPDILADILPGLVPSLQAWRDAGLMSAVIVAHVPGQFIQLALRVPGFGTHRAALLCDTLDAVLQDA